VWRVGGGCWGDDEKRKEGEERKIRSGIWKGWILGVRVLEQKNRFKVGASQGERVVGEMYMDCWGRKKGEESGGIGGGGREG